MDAPFKRLNRLRPYLIYQKFGSSPFFRVSFSKWPTQIGRPCLVEIPRAIRIIFCRSHRLHTCHPKLETTLHRDMSISIQSDWIGTDREESAYTSKSCASLPYQIYRRPHPELHFTPLGNFPLARNLRPSLAEKACKMPKYKSSSKNCEFDVHTDLPCTLL